MDLLAYVALADAATPHRNLFQGDAAARGLAQALIGKPRLLVLDEPTSGLDPVSRRDFYALLDRLAAGGTAILLSSHALSEVEARTDRFLILSKGRWIAECSLADLRRKAALPVAISVTPAAGQKAALSAALPMALANGNGRLHLDIAQDDKLSMLAQINRPAPGRGSERDPAQPGRHLFPFQPKGRAVNRILSTAGVEFRIAGRNR